MATTMIYGLVARETEKAVAFLATTKSEKPLWIPRSKIADLKELDETSKSVQLQGEKIARQATPVSVVVDVEWLEKVTR